MQFNGLPERAVAKNNTDLSAGFDGGLPGNAEVCTFLTPEEDKLYDCVIDTREKPRFAIFGDSKAGALYPGIFRTSEPGGRWLYLGSGKSGPLVTVLSDNPIYGYVNQAAVSSAINTINSFPSIDTVVIATAARALFSLKNDSDIEDLPSSPNFDIALKGFDDAVSALLAAGKDVMLVIDNPTLPPPEDCIVRITGSDMLNRWLGQTRNSACTISVERQLELSAQYRKLLTTIAERHPGKVTLFDTIPLLCDQENGLCSMAMNGRPLYGYTDHISDFSGTMLGTEINGLLEERRQQSAAGSMTE
nr:SGNH hydrolase domain-containing protein [Martelella radicis]